MFKTKAIEDEFEAHLSTCLQTIKQRVLFKARSSIHPAAPSDLLRLDQELHNAAAKFEVTKKSTGIVC